MALGNAYSALSDDPTGMCYNPAALPSSSHSSFIMGYLYNQPGITLKGDTYTGPEKAFDISGKIPLGGLGLDLSWAFEAINKPIKKCWCSD